MGLNISVFGVRYRYQYRFQPGLNETKIADIFSHLLLAGTLGPLLGSRWDRKVPFTAFNIVFYSPNIQTKAKTISDKNATLADFRSSKISANVTVFGCSKFAAYMTFLEGGGGAAGLQQFFL